MNKKPKKSSTPIRPNAGIAARYRRTLEKLIRSMRLETEREILAAYEKPVGQLMQVIRTVTDKWRVVFSKQALRAAEGLESDVLKYTNAAFMQQFSIRMHMTPEMTQIFNASRASNVALIKSIPAQYHQRVEVLVTQSVARGRDIAGLATALRKEFGVTMRRAKLIANDQNNKATAAMTSARYRAMGITRAIWQHSHAGKEPRKSHLDAHGKEFDLEKGLKIDGEYIQPGELINCRCSYRAILPDFSGV